MNKPVISTIRRYILRCIVFIWALLLWSEQSLGEQYFFRAGTISICTHAIYTLTHDSAGDERTVWTDVATLQTTKNLNSQKKYHPRNYDIFFPTICSAAVGNQERKRRLQPCIGEVVRWRPAEKSSDEGTPQNTEGREGSVAAAPALITAAHSSSALLRRYTTPNLTGATVCPTFPLDTQQISELCGDVFFWKSVVAQQKHQNRKLITAVFWELTEMSVMGQIWDQYFI